MTRPLGRKAQYGLTAVAVVEDVVERELCRARDLDAGRDALRHLYRAASAIDIELRDRFRLDDHHDTLDLDGSETE